MNEVVSPVRLHVHHVALTVSDLDASVAWYEEVFAVGYLMDAPHEGGTARILADPEWTLMFALHRHDANPGEPFAESRTGLDHVGFLVPTRDDLERWQEHLQRPEPKSVTPGSPTCAATRLRTRRSSSPTPPSCRVWGTFPSVKLQREPGPWKRLDRSSMRPLPRHRLGDPVADEGPGEQDRTAPAS